LQLVTVTELVSSSGIIRLSMPARLECNHFRPVSFGHTSCITSSHLVKLSILYVASRRWEEQQLKDM